MSSCMQSSKPSIRSSETDLGWTNGLAIELCLIWLLLYLLCFAWTNGLGEGGALICTRTPFFLRLRDFER